MRAPLKSKRASRGEITSSDSIPAPILGWNTRDAEARTPVGFATQLENLFPSSSDVRLRLGKAVWATGLPSSAKVLMSYTPATGNPVLFGATDTGIFDVTANAAVGAASSVISDGACQYVNFRTSGNSYLAVVNGVDNYRYWDGAAWTAPATLTKSGGGNLTTNTISSICAFKRRLFLGIKGTLDFYTLPLDSITGNVDFFPLGALFSKGGSLKAMETWTIDSGSGIDDRMLFLTTRGQIALYQGTDPTSATAFSLIGVYDLAEPIGVQPFMKFGGDVLLLTRDGVFPISHALQDSRITSAISDVIQPSFAAAATANGANFGWCACIDERYSMLLVNIPTSPSGISATQYVMNTKSNAWCSFTGWNGISLVYHNKQLYFGGSTTVSRVNIGAADDGANIVGLARCASSYLGTRGRGKMVNALRPLLRMQGTAAIESALDIDFRTDGIFGPASFIGQPGGIFDTSLWDAANWGEDSTVLLNWQIVSTRDGYTAAPRLRITSSSAIVAWFATDLAYELGAVI